MRTTFRPTRTRALLPAVLAVVLALGACGGGGDDAAADDDVATLGANDDDGGDDSDDEDDEGGGGRGGRGGEGPSPEFQDAMLEYAECMRDQGIDMPDPSFTEDGGVMIGGGAVVQQDEGDGGGNAPSMPDMEAMEEADAECSHIMEAVRDEMPEPDPEQLAEMQDEALEFAECMREHGVDFPDPVFEDGGGRVTVGVGGPGEGGIDPSDEDFQEAAEECGDGTFGFGPAIGVGPGGSDDEGDDEGDE